MKTRLKVFFKRTLMYASIIISASYVNSCTDPKVPPGAPPSGGGPIDGCAGAGTKSSTSLLQNMAEFTNPMGKKIETLSNENSGEISATLKEFGIESTQTSIHSLKNQNKFLNNKNLSANQQIGTLIVDVDIINDNNYFEYEKKIEDALNNSVVVLYESSSNNNNAIVNYFNKHHGGIENAGDITGFVVERGYASGRGNVTRTTPLGPKYNNSMADYLGSRYNPNDLKDYLAKELNENKMIDSKLMNEHKKNMANQKISNNAYGTTVTTGHTNVNPEDILKYDGVIEDFSAQWLTGPVSNIVSASSGEEVTTWIGCQHDAKGSCKGAQTASFGLSNSFTNTWSISLSVGPKYKTDAVDFTEVAGALTGGWSSSTTSTTTNGSSRQMVKRYTQPYVYVVKNDVEGKFTGILRLTYYSRNDDDLGRVKYVRTFTYTTAFDGDLSWNGERIKSAASSGPFFAWSEWGDDLPECN